MKVADLSICIVNWNTRDLLIQCLTSVVQGTEGVDYEIVVVDNASTDRSVHAVQEGFPQVKLIVNSSNLGFAKAANRVIIESKGRYVLLLNPDTRPLYNAIGKMVEFMDSHSETGALGCRLLNPDLTLQPSCFSFPTLETALYDALLLSWLFPQSSTFGKYRVSFWKHDSVREVDSVTGACLLLRRKAIDQIGLLDERFFMYYEESDWCYRMRQKGWKIYFIPHAEVVHYFSGSIPVLSGLTAGRSMESMYYFFRKHYGLPAAVALIPLTILRAVNTMFVGTLMRLLGEGKKERVHQQVRWQWLILKWHLLKLLGW